MSIPIIDTHSHIHFHEYDDDRDAVILRMQEANVKMIAVGTDIETSSDALLTVKKYPQNVLGATVGLHPTYTEEDFDYLKYKNTAADPSVVAIGECGLDYYRVTDAELLKRQKEIFERQIDMAAELKKPLVIHCRKAFPDLIAILKAKQEGLLKSRAGVIHFFSGTLSDAEKLTDLGFYLGFGGVITFAREYDEILKKSPKERILVETDAPYVAPIPHRGKRNEPSFIAETVHKMAEIRGESTESMKKILADNTKSLFGLAWE